MTIGQPSNAKKNPLMNLLGPASPMSLWLFRFFFRSVNTPSTLLFVLGIHSQPFSW